MLRKAAIGCGRGAKYCWHVDPLDGTTNFAHGYPCFAVSIGLTEDGEPIAGAVFNPIADELFTAARGEGAYLNGKPIRVSSVEKLAHSLVATGFRRISASEAQTWSTTGNLRCAPTASARDGSAALDLCSVACGRFDAFWEFRLNSWDTAAGMLLVREAGGTVTDLAGRSYRPGGFDMLASNGRIHEEMRDIATEIGERTTQDA